jgi:hypothetical protein
VKDECTRSHIYIKRRKSWQFSPSREATCPCPHA